MKKFAEYIKKYPELRTKNPWYYKVFKTHAHGFTGDYTPEIHNDLQTVYFGDKTRSQKVSEKTSRMVNHISKVYGQQRKRLKDIYEQ